MKIKEVTTGMICSSDVTSKSGQLLIPENTEILAKHLRLIKAWGITELPISVGDQRSEDTNTIANQASNEELERRFRYNVPSLPIVIEMKKILMCGEFLGNKA
ncbi:MAG: hypothetical protein JKY01_09860 [Pseudomonadales bacterium]|nr:hypothetical protein [Pseudomonadales bacterium]